MSKIYIMFVDESAHAVDWITYCRAHMLYQALPNCAGIYNLSSPPAPLKNEAEGWSVFLLCHGNDSEIGGLKGAALAAKLHPVLSTKLGFIHLQSCKTGVTPASELATELGNLGHQLFLKAPSDNATFTLEIGFRVLDRGNFSTKLSDEYKALVQKHEGAGKKLVDSHRSGGDLKEFCKTVYEATEQFWKDFSKLFMQCALPLNIGWKGYETTPPKGAKAL